MDDSGSEYGGVAMVMGPPCESLVDVESEEEASKDEHSREENLAVRLGCDCGVWFMSFGCLCQPCEKDSKARGVPSKISSNLSCPVGGEEEVVSGTSAAANDNGIAIYGRIGAIGERL